MFEIMLHLGSSTVYSNQNTVHAAASYSLSKGVPGPVVGSCCCVGRHPGTSGSEFL